MKVKKFQKKLINFTDSKCDKIANMLEKEVKNIKK